MAKLSPIDKAVLEDLLQMGDGYVLEFSNATFEDFCRDSVGVNIYHSRYDRASGSKANRLRQFWEVEEPPLVAKLLEDLYELWKHQNLGDGYIDQETGSLMMRFEGVLDKLKQQQDLDGVEVLERMLELNDYRELSRSVMSYIRDGNPSLALDRLHTLLVRYLRSLGKKHGFSHGSEVPLHSLLGSYIKAKAGLSETTQRILKTSISNLEAFNDVRNNASYAHDNEILSAEESRFVVGSVMSLLRFIDSLEQESGEEQDADDDIPF